METTEIILDDIYALAFRCLTKYGADDKNAAALAQTIMAAERDCSLAHGLFRLPAYVASLRSGKINGKARPRLLAASAPSAVLRVDGDNGFAQTAHEVGLPALAEMAQQTGVAILAVNNVYHMAALWPEAETLAQQGLAALVCNVYLPAVAPAGAKKPLFGTNPLAFAWPRPGGAPVVFDMATAAMAKGEVMIAAREGRAVPLGVGLDKHGAPTTAPAEIVDGGVLLPFGGYKGSALSMMVELLAAGLINDYFSFEAQAADNNDGGPARGGQFILAMSPPRVSGEGDGEGGDWAAHCEEFFTRLLALEGVRLPGARRHNNRDLPPVRHINTALLEKVRGLVEAES